MYLLNVAMSAKCKKRRRADQKFKCDSYICGWRAHKGHFTNRITAEMIMFPPTRRHGVGSLGRCRRMITGFGPRAPAREIAPSRRVRPTTIVTRPSSVYSAAPAATTKSASPCWLADDVTGSSRFHALRRCHLKFVVETLRLSGVEMPFVPGVNIFVR